MKQGRRKGTPKTGGRRKGTPNKVTVAVKEAALQHGPAAVAELARLMTEGRTDQVRIAACREILDRAYGKSRQSIEHTGADAGPIAVTTLSDREKMRRLAVFLLEDKVVSQDSNGKMRVIGDIESDASGANCSDNP